MSRQLTSEAGESAGSVPSSLISTAFCLVVSGLFLNASADCWHWFIVPVTLAGIIVGIHAVEWFRSRMDIFDPAGLVGLYGLHFFFFAPLIHVSRNFYIDGWLIMETAPVDWRPWIGRMALLNLAGLLLYFPAVKIFSRPPAGGTLRRTWVIDRSRFWIILPCFLAGAALVQLWVYLSFGGLMGYINAFQDETATSSAFEGLGRVFLFSESFPIFFMIGFIVIARSGVIPKNKLVFFSVLVVFLLLCIFFGGLRGARGATVYKLFIGVGMLHFLWFPISRKLVVAGVVFLMSFMYAYGFYKWGGIEGLTAMFNAKERAAWLAESDKTFERTLLFDLGRYDVQTHILYRLSEYDEYDYGRGRSYLGGVSLYIPRSLWPDRPPTKRKEGTEAIFGRGSYVEDEFEASGVYGLAGEVMLNFTWVPIPLAYGLLGVMVGSIRRFERALHPDDERIFLLSFLSVFCFMVLAWDSNNLVTFAMRYGVPTLVVILLTFRRIPTAQLREGAAESVPIRRSISSEPGTGKLPTQP